MAILQVRDLVKTYGKDDTTVTALGGVSFNVEKGEFVAVVGASGSGKSTLMHLIGGVDRHTSGSVVVDGNEIFKRNKSELAIFRRRNIGLIHEAYEETGSKSAKTNRSRTFWTLAGIVLSTAMITAVFGFAASGDAMIRTQIGDNEFYKCAFTLPRVRNTAERRYDKRWFGSYVKS